MRPAAEVHAAALSDLSEEFATIVNTDEVLRELHAPEPLVTD
jgi:isochorismate hydrolase